MMREEANTDEIDQLKEQLRKKSTSSTIGEPFKCHALTNKYLIYLF